VSGQFEGIGASLAAESPAGSDCSPAGDACALVVVRALPGAPAEKAGLLAGDRVLAVDGTPVAGKTLDDVVKLIRGPRGTPVVLRISRNGPPFDVTVTRDVISSVDVSTRLLAGGTAGYIHIDAFGSRVAADFAAQLGDLVTNKQVRNIIIDLRDDPGGFVDQARAIASQFIADGPILWQQAAGMEPVAQEALPGGVATDTSVHVVVLVNRGTASASEIVAGALQDRGRARLVGEQTFGKGTIQEWQVLGGDTGGFRLTIAKWLTPNKRWIHHVGLVPDVLVSAEGAPAGTDPVLDKALELLAGQSAGVPARRAA
jgi:carboxyl-terminal processing protease